VGATVSALRPITIDLNRVAAGIEAVPEAGPHTSFQARVVHVGAQGRIPDLAAAKQSSVAGSRASAGLVASLWLCSTGRSATAWLDA
jgi:hypothetical protein